MSQPRRSTKRKFYERVSRACDMCRKKKMKCDQAQPCRTCQDRGFNCTYSGKRAPTSDEIIGPGYVRDDQGRICIISPNEVNQEELEMANINTEHTCTDQLENSRDHDRASSNPPRFGSLSHDEDTIGGKNIHTAGTEFYGSSSNFVLLNQLLSKARKLSENQNEISLGTSDTPASIVDILYDSQSVIPDQVPPTPVTAAGRTSHFCRSQSSLSPDDGTSFAINLGDTNPNIRDAFRQGELWNCFIGSPMRLEMEYISLYFQNIHVSLPFLDRDLFFGRCNREIWIESSVKQLRRDQMHFFALYNAVLAVASLTANTDAFYSLRQELEFNQELTKNTDSGYAPSSLHLSKLYFWRARHLLGDLCEACSIESTQTLLLMSIYCQHALKPHACYMYSGMTLRSALAIGLPNKNWSSQDPGAAIAIRTWEAIYVQDIEISCSSGKLSTLSEPRAHGLPQHREPSDERFPKTLTHGLSENAYLMALINLSAVVQCASRQLYHRYDSITSNEKSKIAMELDQQLMEWRADLTVDLSIDFESFSEPEIAAKQRLSLQTRFYYTRMLIHRPFLSAISDELTEEHLKICFAAAQDTIKLIHDAYKHRHYFRTWWHNTIHVLYASLVLIHGLLLESSQIPVRVVIEDVQKAIRILDSMKDLKVARRCTDLIKEIFHITKCYVNKRQNSHAESSAQHEIQDPHYLADGPDQDPLLQSGNYLHEGNFPFNALIEDIFPIRNDILACFEDLGSVGSFAIDVDSAT